MGYAVVVSKKIARLSVTRHRIKRRVLAALSGLSLPRSLVILPKASAGELSPMQMRTELSSLLSKLPPTK
jgi:ribonuclease P protein component